MLDFTAFSLLLNFYKQLRDGELFFKYLLQIERHLRSLMSYYFAEMYGEDQSAYLDIHHFNDTNKTHRTTVRLIATLQRAAKRIYLLL